jgi:hypothetical protein
MSLKEDQYIGGVMLILLSKNPSSPIYTTRIELLKELIIQSKKELLLLYKKRLSLDKS